MSQLFASVPSGNPGVPMGWFGSWLTLRTSNVRGSLSGSTSASRAPRSTKVSHTMLSQPVMPSTPFLRRLPSVGGTAVITPGVAMSCGAAVAVTSVIRCLPFERGDRVRRRGDP